MDFVTESFQKDETAITPKSEDKYVVKVFNWSDFHLFEMTCSGNALERVQRVHEPADLWDITFCTR